nr:MAG TPA: Hemagglutinin tri-stalk stem, Long alpha helix.7A [Caudoviricetes sp.]
MLHAVTEHAISNDSRIRKSFIDLYEKTKKALGNNA